VEDRVRLVTLSLLLMGCGAPDALDTDGVAASGPLVVDLAGEWGPEPAPKGFVRGVHLRFDLGEAGLAFNDTGVLIAASVPAGGATPLLPLPTSEASLQLHDTSQAGLPVVASSGDLPVDGGFGLVGVYGDDSDPRSLALRIDPTPVTGRVKIRAIHTTPGLPYIGLGSTSSGPLASLTYGEVGDYFDVPADATLRWYADLNADNVPDLPFVSFSLPAVDSLGFGQVVDLFVIPTGARFPDAPRLPVPALLLVPLDAPDGIIVVVPDV
jgi:hypothetical protein